MYMYICLCIWISQCKLFSGYNVTCMHFFGIDCLAPDNQLGYSSLQKTISPTPPFPPLPTILSVGLRSHGLLSFRSAMPLVSFLFGSHLGNHVLPTQLQSSHSSRELLFVTEGGHSRTEQPNNIQSCGAQFLWRRLQDSLATEAQGILWKRR